MQGKSFFARTLKDILGVKASPPQRQVCWTCTINAVARFKDEAWELSLEFGGCCGKSGKG